MIASKSLFQFDDCTCTVMVDDYPEDVLFINSTKQTINKKQTTSSTTSCPIAKGEGKIPTNMLRDIHWDINSFPSLHLSGKYSLNYERKVDLYPQQYFNQRLLNFDKRFSNNAPYVFAATYFVERYQLAANKYIS